VRVYSIDIGDVPAMVFGPLLTLDPTLVDFVGLFVLVITGTIDLDDVLSEKDMVWCSPAKVFPGIVVITERDSYYPAVACAALSAASRSFLASAFLWS
jgi:DASS family divalent anion:Na+ symporter